MKNIIAGAVAVVFFLALSIALGVWCSAKQESIASTQLSSEVLLQVNERVFDKAGWKTCGSILVTRDGSYCRTVNSFSDLSAVYAMHKGHLPPSILRALESDILRGTGFEMTAGVAKYEFGIDNHRVCHPAGITELLASIESDEIKRDQK